MNKSAETARRQAFLHQYLVHKAIRHHQAPYIELNITAPGNINQLTFPVQKDTRIGQPPKPPGPAMPEHVSRIEEDTIDSPEGPLLRWAWPRAAPFLHQWVVAYTHELLQYVPAIIRYTGTAAYPGGCLDPMTHRAVPDLSEQIDEQTTVIAVLHTQQPQIDWTTPDHSMKDNPARPNIIFPTGLARASADLSRITSRICNAASLAPGEHRGPTHTMYLEFRVVTTRPLRQQPEHPNTPGLNKKTIDQAIQTAHRLTRAWLDQNEALGLSIDTGPGGPTAGPHTVFSGVPTQPFGEPGQAIARHPVQLHQNHHDPSLRNAVGAALMANTKYTLVQTQITPDELVIDRLTGVTTDDPPRHIQFDTRSGQPKDDLQADRHHLVRPMRDLNLEARVTTADNPDTDVAFPLLALMTTNPDHPDPNQMHRLYITSQGRETLNHDQVCRLLMVPRLHKEHAQTIAHAALQSRDKAFETELTELLEAWTPRAGWPVSDVRVTFNPGGFHLN